MAQKAIDVTDAQDRPAMFQRLHFGEIEDQHAKGTVLLRRHDDGITDLNDGGGLSRDQAERVVAELRGEMNRRLDAELNR